MSDLAIAFAYSTSAVVLINSVAPPMVASFWSKTNALPPEVQAHVYSSASLAFAYLLHWFG